MKHHQKHLAEVKGEIGKKIDVSRIYHFGSRARGTHHDDSDYDVAVISPDFHDMDILERLLLVRPLVRKVLGEVSLDVVCYTQGEYEKGNRAFPPWIIEEEGIVA